MQISKAVREFGAGLAFLVFVSPVIALIIKLVGRYYPIVGHDYGVHIPRMLDTHLYQLLNGLAVQWYTPSFGSGLPAYPNPQHIQYSLPQVLLFFTDPWSAILISIALYACLGAIGFYLFLKNIFQLGWFASTLGALFIIANGFYLEHNIVGHIGYQQFPLLGLILLILFSKKNSKIFAGILIGSIGALIIHQAGFYLILIFALSLLIIFPILYFFRPTLFDWQRIISICILSVTFMLMLSASKLLAVYSLMKYFPREIEDVSTLTYLQGLAGIVLQLLGGMSLVWLAFITPNRISDITSTLQKATGTGYGIWEIDLALSPAIFILFICFGWLFLNELRQKKRQLSLSKEQVIASLMLVLGLWITTDLAIAQGAFYQLTKSLPIFKSLHANVRFASAFIFPASLLAAYSFHQIEQHFGSGLTKRAVLFLFLFSISVGSFALYLLVDKNNFLVTFNLHASSEAYTLIQAGKTFSVKEITNVTDDKVFRKRASSLWELDEALFGYSLEDFHPRTKLGPILEVENGYYNMTNPASYVYPDENNLFRFEKFRADQRTELENFINHRPLEMQMSISQKLANLCSRVMVVFILGYFVTQFAVLRFHSRRSLGNYF